MNEKTKLLSLFDGAIKEVEAIRTGNEEIRNDEELTDSGKTKKLERNRQIFRESIDAIREDMLAVIDNREADYAAYHKKEFIDRMKSDSYQQTLDRNISTLRSGMMGKLETMAILELYSKDDMATERIYQVMREIHSPYCDELMEDKITVRKQMNAFDSMRNIIKSKVNVGMLDLSGRYTPKGQDAAYSWFGSGYYAIVNELNEDLSINAPNASLGIQANADERNRMYYGENFKDILQDKIKLDREKQSNKNAAIREKLQNPKPIEQAWR